MDEATSAINAWYYANPLPIVPQVEQATSSLFVAISIGLAVAFVWLFLRKLLPGRS